MKFIKKLMGIALCLNFVLLALPLEISELKKAIEEHYDSGKFNRELQEVLLKAERDLATIAVTENSIVVFDVDDTVISHLEYFKYCILNNLDPDETFWDYIKAANSPAIQHVLEFYKKLVSRGFKVIFLTARKEKYRQETHRTLLNAGYTDFEKLILKTDEHQQLFDNLPDKSGSYKKHCRKQLVEQEGFTIVACVGDQKSDVEGDHSGIQIKLPNYLYFTH